MLFFRLDLLIACIEWMGLYSLMTNDNNSRSNGGPARYGGTTPPRVRLPQGTYEGSISIPTTQMAVVVGVGQGNAEPPPPPSHIPKAVDSFLGIPYAQSTTGNNRFRRPVALNVSSASADTLHQATKLGLYCPGSGLSVGAGEDCLNVNIYRPMGVTGGAEDGRTTNTSLPVALYVHGGGFNSGMGSERNMADFCRYSEVDLVCVSFNYRVGALGFLNWSPADSKNLTQEEKDAAQAKAPLNIGLYDQQAAFTWVRENIAYFGGNPNNVTVMGLSAGAHSIGHHLMYYAKGEAPFQKAILESGATTARAVWSPNHPRPKKQVRQFLIKAGILNEDDSQNDTNQTDPSIPDRLRALPLGTLLSAGRSIWGSYQQSVAWPFQPVIDGIIIPRAPIQSWRMGNVFTGVPVLTGFDTNEGAAFVPKSRAMADTDEDFRTFFKVLLPALSAEDINELAELYEDPVSHPDTSPYVLNPLPAGITGRQFARLDAAYAHFAYICPVLQTAHYLSNTTNFPGQTIHVYQYAATGSYNMSNHGDNAAIATHTESVVKDHPGLEATSEQMHGAYVRFMSSPNGDPNYNIANVSSSGNEIKANEFVHWAPFVSPFNASAAAGNVDIFASSSSASSTSASKTKRQEEEEAPTETPSGLLQVYGEGNNERMSANVRIGPVQTGTPAALRPLNDFEKRQCEFWWARIDLSEGLGQRDGSTGQEASSAISSQMATVTATATATATAVFTADGDAMTTARRPRISSKL